MSAYDPGRLAALREEAERAEREGNNGQARRLRSQIDDMSTPNQVRDLDGNPIVDDWNDIC